MGLLTDLQTAVAASRANLSVEAAAAKDNVLDLITATLTSEAQAGRTSAEVKLEDAFPSLNLDDVEATQSHSKILVDILRSEGLEVSPIAKSVYASWS